MAGNCQDEERETQGNVPLSTIELGSCEVLYDHGHTTEDIEDIDEFPEEPTETMLPPPPSSRLQKTKTRSTRGETTCRANMPDLCRNQVQKHSRAQCSSLFTLRQGVLQGQRLPKWSKNFSL